MGLLNLFNKAPYITTVSGYRLRVGNFRVIFDREGNILHIEEIDNRGQVYK